jgi:thiol-disulfide isomerase/thioredoxin
MNKELEKNDVELSVDELKTLISTMDKSDKSKFKTIILKFGATWCKPCQDIKKHCNTCFAAMPETVKCYDIDIDLEENIELYSILKNKKMVRGVPTLLAYVNKPTRDMNQWYASDMSVSGSNSNNITLFFQTIKNY